MNNPKNILVEQESFSIGRLDNGYLFGTYDLTTDQTKTIYYATPEALGDAIVDWQVERVAKMVAGLKRGPKIYSPDIR